MYHVTFTPIATEEYAEAVDWYASKSIPSAERFIKAVNKKLDLISVNPEGYKKRQCLSLKNNVMQNKKATHSKRLYPKLSIFDIFPFIV